MIRPVPLSALCSVLIGLLSCPAALAIDLASDGGAGPAVQSNAPVGQNKVNKQSFRITRLPLYLVGITSGAFVGMPVNLVRRLVWEEKQGIQGLAGDSKSKAAVYSAGAFWLPFSVFLGAVEAPVLGPVNSLRYFDKPFSKEQFSLGEIGDTNREPQ